MDKTLGPSPFLLTEAIEKMSHELQQVPGALALLLIGSRARGDASPNSDWDFSLLVGPGFEPEAARVVLQQVLSSQARLVLHVRLRDNLTAYLESGSRVEINYYTSLQGLERNFMGSEIPPERIEACILFDHTQQVHAYLAGLDRKAYHTQYFDLEALINKFAYEFENSSSNHRRSDSYRFYYHYNIALNVAVQLSWLCKGHKQHAYLPKNFFRQHYEPKNAERCKEISASLWLPDANGKKRNLLEFFYASLDRLAQNQLIAAAYARSIRDFLEWVYARDFFWNLRDVAKFNPALAAGRVFRSASLTLIQHHPQAREVVVQLGLTEVVDLRDRSEVQASSYTDEFLQGLRYHHLPVDPSDQSESFRQQYAQAGTHVEIAYRYFAIECRECIARWMRVLIEAQGAVLIHCHAGKDRTGAFVTLLHLLTPTPAEVWMADYLASEMDTNPDHLNAFLELIDAEGGILGFLANCGLHEAEIEALTSKLVCA